MKNLDQEQTISRRGFTAGVMATAAATALATALPDARVKMLSHFAEVGSTLKTSAKSRGLLYGSPVFPNDLDNGPYLNLAKEQISIVTNTVYASVTQPSEDAWNLEGFRKVRDLAKSTGMRMRGHPLVWHDALPDWMTKLSSLKQAETCIEHRIKTLVGMWPGQFHSWDVVNEAVDVNSKRPDHLTECVWAQYMGLDYLDIAFHLANLADPGAALTYNDYGTEDDSEGSIAKREIVFGLLEGMIKRKVPIRAFGLQSHLSAGQKFATLPDWIKRIKGLGLRVFVTELDVNDSALPTNIVQRDAAVAGTYREFLTQALSVSGIEIVLNWGLCDSMSWLNFESWSKRKDGTSQRPLPFDQNLAPTAVFEAMDSSFKTR